MARDFPTLEVKPPSTFQNRLLELETTPRCEVPGSWESSVQGLCVDALITRGHICRGHQIPWDTGWFCCLIHYTDLHAALVLVFCSSGSNSRSQVACASASCLLPWVLKKVSRSCGPAFAQKETDNHLQRSFLGLTGQVWRLLESE